MRRVFVKSFPGLCTWDTLEEKQIWILQEGKSSFSYRYVKVFVSNVFSVLFQIRSIVYVKCVDLSFLLFLLRQFSFLLVIVMVDIFI